MKIDEKTEEKAMSKRELISEISEVTNLKPAIVKSVLDAFTDIFIRESVIKGKFYLANCFSVKTNKRKERRGYNVAKKKYEIYPATEILSITLAKGIHHFHRWKQRHEFNEKHGLTVEDWRNREDEDIPE